jgi:DNA-binding XRE family transcriptional regulator
MPKAPLHTETWKEVTAGRPDSAARRAANELGRNEALPNSAKMRAVTQAELAHQLGVAQPSLSALERRGDVQLSTLRHHIEGLGGHLEVSAVFDDVRIPVTLFVE